MSKGQGDPQDWSLGNDHTVRLISGQCIVAGMSSSYGVCRRRKTLQKRQLRSAVASRCLYPQLKKIEDKKKAIASFYLYFAQAVCAIKHSAKWNQSCFCLFLIHIPGIVNLKKISLYSIFGFEAVLIMFQASSLFFALYRKLRPYGLYSDSDECYRLYHLCDILHWWSRWLAGPQDLISYSILSTSQPNHVQIERCSGGCCAKPLT